MNPYESAVNERLDRMERLERIIGQLIDERDAYLAYAAMLQSIATIRRDYSQWTSEEAVEHVRRQAVLNCLEATDAGWSAADVIRLSECRGAVRAAREREA